MSQSDFYAIDSVREIRLYFFQSNWDEILDSLYVLGERERLAANVVVDGNSYLNAGVRYKGFSSYSENRIKNPLNIDLDFIDNGQNHLGHKKLKLSNVIQDPSFVREALSYEVARKYMPASRANFANVYINDTLIGLYTNVEAVDELFLENHFGTSDNAFFKGNPESLDLNGENSNLSDSPGPMIDGYFPFYKLKSDNEEDWFALQEFIDTLNNSTDNISEVLNVDRALWMHALNYTMINFDSYVGYAQNYYLYQDRHGRFNPLLWDLNMSFASYRLTDASDHWDGFTIEEAKYIDPLQHLNSFSVQPRPLIRNVISDDTKKRMYLAHIRTIVEENFDNQDYMSRCAQIQTKIDSSVLADTNKFYSYSDFTANLTSTVSDLVDYPGISELMDDRSVYLLGL
ncbi:MAG: CotH kinase family protein, partial [Crocinitomicaceae bacterium]|nr:CotH kinase family protein [Crocinitomicaceae bacterium]